MNAPLDSGAPSEPQRMNFEQWLAAVETFRDLGCPSPNFKEPEGWSDSEKAWMGLVNDTKADGVVVKAGLKTQWNATQEAYAAFINPQLTQIQDAELKATIEKGLKFTVDIMGPPFRTAFMAWAMDKPYVREYIASITDKTNDDVHYDEFRAKMLEAFGQDLTALGNSRMLDDEHNNSYVTQRADGTWEKLDSDRVAELLRKSAANDGPQVIVTANHAYGETMDDVTPITNGYTELVNEVTKGRARLKPLAEAGKGDTVMIAALNTRANNFLNLSQLFQRLYDVEMADKGDPRKDTFEHVSPIAMMMVETLLKAASEHPENVKLNTSVRPPTFTQGNVPIQLRADAADIMRKAIFFGFSKGGNDFRDGMRLLVRTLDSKLPDGKATFEAAPGSSIWDIVSNISVTVQSMNEKPMHPYYRGCQLNEDGSVALDEEGKEIKLHEGAAVTYFTNAHDTIALSPDIKTTDDDRSVIYDGRKTHSGHHPGVISENLYQHPYIMQHHRCVLAATMGMAAIRFVQYQTFDEPTEQDPTHKRHGLVIKTAQGTTDAMFEKALPDIRKALAKNRLGHIHVVRIPGTQSSTRYELRSELGEDDLLSRGTVMRLIETFEELRDHSSNLVVSSAVHYPNLSTLMKDLAQARYVFREEMAQELGAKDWKDLIRISSNRVYDHNIARANELAAMGLNFEIPSREDMPAAAGVGR